MAEIVVIQETTTICIDETTISIEDEATICTEEVTLCTDNASSSYPAALYGPNDSERVEELRQEIELWRKEAKLWYRKYAESSEEVVQFSILLQQPRHSLRSKLDDANEKIASLTIENSFLQRQNSISRREVDELWNERENLMFQLSSRPADYQKINELKQTVAQLTADKNVLQGRFEELNAKLRTLHSSKTSEHKLYQKMTEIKLENAQLNKRNQELNNELQEITETIGQLNKQNQQMKVDLQETTEKNAEIDKYERFLKRSQSLNLTSPPGDNTLDGCTACMKKTEELDALKSQLIELEKDHEELKKDHEELKKDHEQTKQENIDFLQSEMSDEKLAEEESSIEVSDSEVPDDCATRVRIMLHV